MRWFYAPNEARLGDQVGPRMAFTRLLQAGVFTAYEAYSYLVRATELRDPVRARQDFVDAARAFNPDVIFIQHLTRQYPIDVGFLDALKSLPSRPKLVAHEGDPYNWARKRLDPEPRLLFAAADMTILVGLGSLRQLVQRTGARRIRLSPHSFDTARFGQPWSPTRTRRFDAVMIANLTYFKRLPGVYLPGGRYRRATAEAMYRSFGDRVAVFGDGQGWRGRPYAKGPIPFDQQEAIVRDAWMSFNWHHFDDIAFYSSDRLQISLAAGVPHITNRQPGYAHLFDGIPGLFIVESPEEAADVAHYLMSRTLDQRNELGRQAAVHARSRFDAVRVYTEQVAVILEQLYGLTTALPDVTVLER